MKQSRNGPPSGPEIIIRELKRGKDTDAVLAALKKAWPSKRYTPETINYFRNQLRRGGHKPQVRRDKGR